MAVNSSNLYFKDRIPDPIHGQNAPYYDAVSDDGALKLSDFKLELKNNIPPDRQGDPVNAANLNYASGVADLPAGAGQAISRGKVLSLLGGGEVSPAYTTRPVALTGTANMMGFNMLEHDPIANTAKYIMFEYVYGSSSYNQMRVMTVNFNAKTVSFGAPLGINQFDNAIEVLSPTLVAYTRYGNMQFMHINGTTITEGNNQNVNAPVGGTGLIGKSRIVRNGANRVVAAATSAVTGGSLNICLISYAAGVITQVASTNLGLMNQDQLTSLISLDGGVSRYAVFWRSGYIAYSRYFEVNGNYFVLGNTQNLGYNQIDLAFVNGGSSIAGAWTNKALFSTPFSPTTPGGGIVQAATFDANGAATFGNQVGLSVLFWYSQIAGLFAHLRDDGTAYLTGMYMTSPTVNKLIEIEPAGGANIIAKQYTPFMYPSPNTISAGSAAAVENPTSRGEFLFIESTSYQTAYPKYYFGAESDSANPNNIAGIALDSPVNGYVKVQTTGKLLPGVASNLVTGQWYSAGSNGTLVPYDGSKPRIALATAPDSILFTGPIPL